MLTQATARMAEMESVNRRKSGVPRESAMLAAAFRIA